MRRADARRSASIMISSSIRWSLAGAEVDWMTKVSSPADVLQDLDPDFLIREAPHHGRGKAQLRDARRSPRPAPGWSCPREVSSPPLTIPANWTPRLIAVALAGNNTTKP